MDFLIEEKKEIGIQLDIPSLKKELKEAETVLSIPNDAQDSSIKPEEKPMPQLADFTTDDIKVINEFQNALEEIREEMEKLQKIKLFVINVLNDNNQKISKILNGIIRFTEIQDSMAGHFKDVVQQDGKVRLAMMELKRR